MYGGGGHAQFDSNAFSGGFFMPSQTTQTAAGTSISPAKNRESQSLIPLTVKQISNALQSSDDKMNFLIGGVDVTNVKLVGMMLNKTDRTTDVQFVIDDGTGRIDCHKWFGDSVDHIEMGNVQDRMYVVVHGRLSGFGDKKQIMVYSVRPVTDHNEITYHFAQCIYVHLYNSRLQKQKDIAPTSAPISNSRFNTPLHGYQASSTYHSNDEVQRIEKSILDYLNQPHILLREEGVHRDDLAKQLGISPQRVLQACTFLLEEGLVYNPIGDNYYRSSKNA